ncbi:unnamed protein product [Peronospora destructor]|uniref:Uncharacterized protein n=1 Tax=Peronospora destructor TaxID=86335 RepID=A0AAV0V4X5_9STRA|nr:unnamed protein product [Peronospora destructor]
MVHPATASSSAKPRAQLNAFTSSATAQVDEAKTLTHPPVSSLSSIAPKKSQNVADKTTLGLSSRSSTCTTSAGVTTSGNTSISCMKPGADASVHGPNASGARGGA